MAETPTMRRQLIELVRGGGAHLDFDAAIADLPAKLRGVKPQGLPHTPWRLVEHMRIAQHDILEFCRSKDHGSPDWPKGYWPEGDAPSNDRAWDQNVEAFRDDLQAMQDIVADESNDLFAPIPWGDGQTIFREAMLLADHNSYHLGQLITVRRVLGAWGG